MPDAEEIIAQIIIVTAVAGELPFTLWLLIKGVKNQQDSEGVSLAAPQTEGIGA